MVIKSKKGWIKIVEAFIAIILIAIVVLIILNQNSSFNKASSEKIYGLEKLLLLEIRSNNTLRDDVLNTDPLPSNASQNINDFINSKMPNYLTCQAKVCMINSICELNNYPKTDTYVQSIVMSTSTNLEKYSPRELKIFCFEK